MKEGEAPGRVVALGASNLTRGLPTVVATARHCWGPGVEVVAAAGRGRSYGAESTVLVRTLPGASRWTRCGGCPARSSSSSAPCSTAIAG